MRICDTKDHDEIVVDCVCKACETIDLLKGQIEELQQELEYLERNQSDG